VVGLNIIRQLSIDLNGMLISSEDGGFTTKICKLENIYKMTSAKFSEKHCSYMGDIRLLVFFVKVNQHMTVSCFSILMYSAKEYVFSNTYKMSFDPLAYGKVNSISYLPNGGFRLKDDRTDYFLFDDSSATALNDRIISHCFSCHPFCQTILGELGIHHLLPLLEVETATNDVFQALPKWFGKRNCCARIIE